MSFTYTTFTQKDGKLIVRTKRRESKTCLLLPLSQKMANLIYAGKKISELRYMNPRLAPCKVYFLERETRKITGEAYISKVKCILVSHWCNPNVDDPGLVKRTRMSLEELMGFACRGNYKLGTHSADSCSAYEWYFDNVKKYESPIEYTARLPTTYTVIPDLGELLNKKPGGKK